MMIHDQMIGEEEGKQSGLLSISLMVMDNFKNEVIRMETAEIWNKDTCVICDRHRDKIAEGEIDKKDKRKLIYYTTFKRNTGKEAIPIDYTICVACRLLMDSYVLHPKIKAIEGSE